MGNQSLSKLLEQWESRARGMNSRQTESLSIYKGDLIKIEALASMYKLPKDDVVATLLHEALNEIEAKMPYVQGNKVIRIEDGEEVYEDTGPMPRYLAEQKKLMAT